MFKVIHLQTQKEYLITTPIKVGRNAVGIQIVDDNKISKEHCMFDVDGDQLVVKDLSSSNGTYVNGDRLTPFEAVELKDGDHLQIGKQEFKVRYMAKGEDRYGETAAMTWFQEELERPFVEYYQSTLFFMLMATAFVYPFFYLLSHNGTLWGASGIKISLPISVIIVCLLPALLLMKPVSIIATFSKSKGSYAVLLFFGMWMPTLISLQNIFLGGLFAFSNVDRSIYLADVRFQCFTKQNLVGCRKAAVACEDCEAKLSEEEKREIAQVLGWYMAPPAPPAPPRPASMMAQSAASTTRVPAQQQNTTVTPQQNQNPSLMQKPAPAQALPIAPAAPQAFNPNSTTNTVAPPAPPPVQIQTPAKTPAAKRKPTSTKSKKTSNRIPNRLPAKRR